jgi:pilus assembly protein CpaB
MHRRITGLAAAAVCALVGTLILVGYVHSAEARALSGEQTVDVLVVTDAIDVGTPADEIAGSVKTTKVPAKVRADGAVTDLDELEGLVATVALVPGEQLVRARFAESTRAGVPEGLLEVTVSLDPERALGGQIAEGDHVAVIASFDKDDTDPASTQMILHKVVVTSVLRDATAAAPTKDDDTVAPGGKLMVTLAVDAASVDRIVFAAEHGHVWLSAEPTVAPEGQTPVLTKALVWS